MITTVNNYNRPYEFRGLSTDPKPTMESPEFNGLQNGSTFIEMDTSKVFMYDAVSKNWRQL